jgi:membrane protein implicated in regulation of membrane protease activity
LNQNVAITQRRKVQGMWSDSTIWWLLAGVAVAAEMVTGTFYLLMLAVGLAAGAVAAHLGAGLVVQMVAAAVLGGGAVAAWHWRRGTRPAAAPAASNRDVVMDVGEIVQVAYWRADGLTDVPYRGARWTGQLSEAAGDQRHAGSYRITSVQGNRLVLEPTGPGAAPVAPD